MPHFGDTPFMIFISIAWLVEHWYLIPVVALALWIAHKKIGKDCDGN